MILLLRIIVVGIKIIFGDFIVRLKGGLKKYLYSFRIDEKYGGI